MMQAVFKKENLFCSADIISTMDAVSREALSPYSSAEYVVLPGFCDVHVHFREPGFSYKETIHSGSMAAAAGGYTAVCTMPNLNPVPDCAEHLYEQLRLIRQPGLIRIYPYGAITRGQKGLDLARLQEMSQDVIAFSDDGRGVQEDALMLEAMLQAKKLGKMIVAHCEVNSLLRGGYIHDGEYAKTHGHKGICSESEFLQIQRDLQLVEQTGCAYHVCHISTKESVDLIRQAKRKGLDVTCETAPHYLVMDDADLQEDGRFKMNPPIRSREDRQSLLAGVLDGTIDMIATDHAPHSSEEKNRGLSGSAFGVVGLETAFPVLYTKLVLPGILSMDKLIALLSTNPRMRFGIPFGNDLTVWKLDEEFTVDPNTFRSMGRATPFAGWNLRGKCMLTICDGKIVYQNNWEDV